MRRLSGLLIAVITIFVGVPAQASKSAAAVRALEEYPVGATVTRYVIAEGTPFLCQWVIVSPSGTSSTVIGEMVEIVVTEPGEWSLLLVAHYAHEDQLEPGQNYITTDIIRFIGVSHIFSDGFESGDLSEWSDVLP